VLPALAAAALLTVMPSATVRVPVANVWASPGAGHLPLDPHVWPTPAVTYAQRLALVGHMPTQALYGERVVVTGHRPGWTRIAIPDQPSPLDRRGYPGWVRSWQLGKPLRRGRGPFVVTARTAKLTNGTELSFGTRLPLERRLGKTVQVDTPFGVSRCRRARSRLRRQAWSRPPSGSWACATSGAASRRGASTAPG
jgi:hypothetical protein